MLTFLLVLACLPHTPEQVVALADQAEEDPRDLEKLVKTLASDRDDVWQAAYRELVAFDRDAVPALRAEIMGNDDAAGRALLVLGDLGYAENFDLIRAGSDVPGLRPYADRAFEIAELALWDRIDADPSVTLCDDYLDWFPRGPMAADVESLRYQLAADEALRSLGRSASDSDLLALVRRFPGTAAERRCREILASRSLDAAEDAIVDGMPERALDHIARAAELDDQLDTRPIEARAREALGRRAASRAQLDQAIEELEHARRLGGADPMLLAGLYLKRARTRFERLQAAGALQDLARAEELSDAVSSAVVELRQREADALLTELKERGRGRGSAAHALAYAGEGYRRTAEAEVLSGLSEGDIAPLEGLMLGVRGEWGTLEGRLWGMSVLDQALQNQDAAIRTLMDDDGRLARALSPDDVWARDARVERRELLARTSAYERTVTLAREEVRAGGRILSPLPSTESLSDATLAELIADGASPLERTRAMFQRVQLMRLALQAPERVASTPAEQIAAGLLVDPPAGLLGLAVLVATPHPNSISSAREDARLALRIQSGVADEATLSQALTVLFGGTRLFLDADPGLDAVDVYIVDGGSELAYLSLSRVSAGRLNWNLIESEAPWSTDHLPFVLDQRIP
ncbi:MAG: hypothetical protein GY913_08885 [Proteobacteria bacterium]|nr:hypothetical protein [Pseudomonadota bacterium]